MTPRRLRPLALLFALAAPAAATTHGTPAAASPERDAAITRALCEARRAQPEPPAVCRVAALFDAGRNGAGHTLLVAELAETADPDFESAQVPCRRYEYDLVRLAGDAVVDSQRLTNVCNDGLGDPGCPEGSVDVAIGQNRFERTWVDYRGCNVGRSHDVLRLSPLARLVEERGSELTQQGYSDDESWDWTRPAGRLRERQEVAYAELEPTAEQALVARFGSELTRDGLWIPRFDLGAAYTAGGWKTTELGSCAARITGVAGDGYLLYGDGPGAATAEMRVVSPAAGELVVEVFDDRVVSGARSWLAEDHLELWQAPYVSLGEIATDPRVHVPEAAQWAVRLVDGKVFPAHGHPRVAPRVERVAATARDGRAVTRLHIVLPDPGSPVSGLTIVFSDSDDGRTQQRLIATSDLDANAPWTLGGVGEPPSNRVACELRDGRLDAVSHQQYDPQRTVISQ